MLHKVATFFNPRKPGDKPKLSRISAYTRMYNSSWPGCIVYNVEADTGDQAKIIAARQRLAHEEGSEP